MLVMQHPWRSQGQGSQSHLDGYQDHGRAFQQSQIDERWSFEDISFMRSSDDIASSSTRASWPNSLTRDVSPHLGQPQYYHQTQDTFATIQSAYDHFGCTYPLPMPPATTTTETSLEAGQGGEFWASSASTSSTPSLHGAEGGATLSFAQRTTQQPRCRGARKAFQRGGRTAAGLQPRFRRVLDELLEELGRQQEATPMPLPPTNITPEQSGAFTEPHQNHPSGEVSVAEAYGLMQPRPIGVGSDEPPLAPAVYSKLPSPTEPICGKRRGSGRDREQAQKRAADLLDLSQATLPSSENGFQQSISRTTTKTKRRRTISSPALHPSKPEPAVPTAALPASTTSSAVQEAEQLIGAGLHFISQRRYGLSRRVLPAYAPPTNNDNNNPSRHS